MISELVEYSYILDRVFGSNGIVILLLRVCCTYLYAFYYFIVWIWTSLVGERQVFKIVNFDMGALCNWYDQIFGGWRMHVWVYDYLKRVTIAFTNTKSFFSFSLFYVFGRDVFGTTAQVPIIVSSS